MLDGDNQLEHRLLTYFLMLCEELHFTRAVERLLISQPTLSQLQNLSINFCEQSEHNETIEQLDRESKRMTRPVLDDQEMGGIHWALSEVFHATIQTYRREIKLTSAHGDWRWFRIVDIMGVL